jgi:hypothetical protein
MSAANYVTGLRILLRAREPRVSLLPAYPARWSLICPACMARALGDPRR